MGRAAVVGGIGSIAFLAVTAGAPAAFAAETPVPLGTDTSYAVLAGSAVTNTGVSNISGNLGVSPQTAVSGFPPGIITNGVEHDNDANAQQAQSDLTTAYDTAAGETPQTAVGPDLAGQTLQPGVYGNSAGAGTLGLTGTLTLDGQNNPDALFVFQADSTLITASSSRIVMINGANPCNVYWKVGSSATLGTDSEFRGNILALTSISLNTDANVIGRVLARNGAVTLDSNNVGFTACAAAPLSPTPSPSTSSSATPSSSASPTATASSGSGTGKGTGTGSGLTNGSGTGTTVPTGHPETGEGGAVTSSGAALLAGGGLALVGAVVAAVHASRRRYVAGHSFR